MVQKHIFVGVIWGGGAFCTPEAGHHPHIHVYMYVSMHTVKFVTRGRVVEVVMGWIASGAKNRQRSPWSMDSPRRPLLDFLSQTQKRPNAEPQGVPEILDDTVR